MTNCAVWLSKFLKGRTLPCDEVREAAFQENFTRKDLLKARIELNVVPKAITTWSLPEGEA